MRTCPSPTGSPSCWVSGRPAAPMPRGLQDDDIDLLSILLDELNLKTAVKIAVRLTGKQRNEVYQQALKLRDEQGNP